MIDLAQHQILLQAARDEAYRRGYADAWRARQAALDMLQQESYSNGFRSGLEQGKLQRDAVYASGLPVEREW